MFGKPNLPSLGISAIPLIVLLAALPTVIILHGADAVADTGPWVLLCCALLSVTLAAIGRTATRRGLRWASCAAPGRSFPPSPYSSA